VDRLLHALRQQHDEMLQALKKASLLVPAERDLPAPAAEQLRSDPRAIYEVLDRNRPNREQRTATVIRSSVPTPAGLAGELRLPPSCFSMGLRGDSPRPPFLQTVRRAEEVFTVAPYAGWLPPATATHWGLHHAPPTSTARGRRRALFPWARVSVP
jgi:hypothetical protein